MTKSCYYNGIINTNKFVWSYLGDTRHSEINYPYEDEGENVACVCLCMCVVIENQMLITQALGILKIMVWLNPNCKLAS